MLLEDVKVASLSCRLSQLSSDSPAVTTASGLFPMLPSLRVWVGARNSRCLLSGSSPQLLDVTLRTTQVSVNKVRVGVGADLRRDPGSQPNERGGQSPAQAKDPLQARDGDLYSLPDPTTPLGWLGYQKDVHLGQGLFQILAAVGQVPQEPPRYLLPQSRLVDEFLGQGDVRHVSGSEFVGDGHPVGRTQEVQLHPVDAEGTPPHPRASWEARALGDLPGMQDRKQRRVHEQRLRLADHLGEYVAAQRLQKAPELARPPM